MIPPLHKPTTRNLDLFFFLFFEKLNSLNIPAYLMTSQYFGGWKKTLSHRKVEFHFADSS